MNSIEKMCANIKEEMDAQGEANNTMDKFNSIMEKATAEEKQKMREMLTDPAEHEETEELEENEDVEVE